MPLTCMPPSGHDALWDYMPYGPFASASAYHRWAREREAGDDPRFYVLRDQATGQVGGIASYPAHHARGRIDRGRAHLHRPRHAAGRRATEAMFLMMDWAFRAGYRRYEWKCNALNLASRRAAQRLGFSFEGVFAITWWSRAATAIRPGSR
jgi:RimJ/RimL family protein N-acetyltransferase